MTNIFKVGGTAAGIVTIPIGEISKAFLPIFTTITLYEIRQSLRLRVAPLGVTVRFLPTAKRHRIEPFVGGGVDALFYKYEEVGDFIDFFDPDLAILPDAFVAEDTAFGYHALGGLRVYVNRDFAVVGEGRYQWGKHDMGDDFAPNETGLVNTIDLGGWTFTVGVHLRF